MIVSERRYAPGLEQPRHAHDRMSITLILGGSLLERVGRTEERARALGIVVKPGGTEHANVMGSTGVHTLQVCLDQAGERALCAVEPQFGVWQWAFAGRALPAFLRVLGLARKNSSGEELESAVFEALALLGRDRSRGQVGIAPNWLQQVRERIEDDERERVSAAELARWADVHPVYLARSFRKHFGTSLTEYAQRRRVQNTASRLAQSASRISMIAGAAGFYDQAHLCRAFRRQTSLSPSTYRTLIGDV